MDELVQEHIALIEAEWEQQLSIYFQRINPALVIPNLRLLLGEGVLGVDLRQLGELSCTGTAADQEQLKVCMGRILEVAFCYYPAMKQRRFPFEALPAFYSTALGKLMNRARLQVYPPTSLKTPKEVEAEVGVKRSALIDFMRRGVIFPVVNHLGHYRYPSAEIERARQEYALGEEIRQARRGVQERKEAV